MTDDELEEAVKIVIELDKMRVDGIIIQDMGLLNKLIELKLRIPVHISTQCDNYLKEKVKFFNNIGVSRVVLARDLSIEQISEIHKENPNLELEGFVHGALCVSMSGQCYLSQYIGGRSANRGECAQPCRKKYSIETENGKLLKKDIHALCLKDFNASNKLEELENAGISSFKIEGRLKDVDYVKNITAYYSQKLKNKNSSGKSFYEFEPNPEKSFNRDFTKYFLENRTNCFNFDTPKHKGEYIGEIIEVNNNWFRIKTKKELHPQDGLTFEDEGFLINKIEDGKIFPNKKINLKHGIKIYRNFDSVFEKGVLKPTRRKIGISVEIKEKNVVLTDEDTVVVSCDFQGEKANNPEKAKENFVRQLSKTGESDFYIEDIKIASDNLEIPFLPINEINSLRRNLLENLDKKRLEIFIQNQPCQKEMNYEKYFLNEVDFRANVLNKKAYEFYEKCGCKVLEPALEETKPNRQIQLMRCKHCIKYALNMCKSSEKLVLVDSYNQKYPLQFDCKNCEMSVLSPN